MRLMGNQISKLDIISLGPSYSKILITMSFWWVLACLLTWMSLLNQTMGAVYFPTLNLKLTYNKTWTSNNSQLAKYEVDGQNIFEVYEDGVFNHIYLGQNKTYQNAYFDSSDLNSTLYNRTLADYDFDGSSLYFLLADQQILTVSPQSLQQRAQINLSEITISNNSMLEVTNESYYIINPNSQNQTATVYKYFRRDKITNFTKIAHNAQQNGINITDASFDYIIQAFTEIKGDNIRAKVCRKWFSYDDFLVIWNETSYIQVWTCDYWDCRMRWSLANDIYNDSSITGDVNWGSGCSKLYVEYDGFQPATVYDENTGQITRNYTIDQPIYDFQTVGSSSDSHAGLLLANNSFLLLTPKGIAQKEYTDFGEVTQQSQYSQSARRLTMNYDSYVNVYKFQCLQVMTYYSYWRGMCSDCSKTCSGCNEDNGRCLNCVQGLVKNDSNLMECIPPTPVTINTTVPESVLPVQPVLSVQPVLPVQPAQSPQEIKPNLIPQSAPELKPNGAYYTYEEVLAQTAVKGFDIIGRIIDIVFRILDTVPLAWLFLSFMNFWSISSYYLFLNAQIPEYLTKILQSIYDNINTPIFDLSHVSRHIYPLNQKLPTLYQKQGISSSFLVMNLQNFIILSGCFILIKSLCFIFSFMSQNNLLKQKFQKNIDLHEIIANQFVSMASNFILPFSLILKNMHFSSFIQLPNIFLHLTFVAFSLMFPFLVVKNSKYEAKKSNSIRSGQLIQQLYKNKNKQRAKYQWIQAIEWIYVSNCNTILPLLCVSGIPQIFYLSGVGFFSIGVWVARKTKNSNLNQVILSLHPLLFHVFYAVVSIFGERSMFIKHNSTMICAIILMIGAVHELLTAFCKALYSSGSQIVNLCRRAKTKDQQTVLAQKRLENNETSLKKIAKKINFQLPITKQENDLEFRKSTFMKCRLSSRLNLRQPKSIEIPLQTISKTSLQMMIKQKRQQQLQNQKSQQEVFHEKQTLASVMQKLEKKTGTSKKIKIHKTRGKNIFYCMEQEILPAGSEILCSLRQN